MVRRLGDVDHQRDFFLQPRMGRKQGLASLPGQADAGFPFAKHIAGFQSDLVFDELLIGTGPPRNVGGGVFDRGDRMGEGLKRHELV